MHGGGRPAAAPLLGEDLLQRLVGMARSVRGRISSAAIEQAAKVIREDIRAAQEETASEGPPAEMPTINRMWVWRWRKEYGVAPRSANLVYKISRPKLLHRLKTLWCNTIRIRTLWRCLHKNKPLKFMSADQKPFWFNNLGSRKTMHIKGLPRIEVKENPAQTRERYTAMSVCFPLSCQAAPCHPWRSCSRERARGPNY